MEETSLSRINKVILYSFIIYFIVSIPMRSLGFVHIYMIWNVFLSLIPLFLAEILKKDMKFNGKKIKKSLTFVFWLLFFPNAPYMVTDFIHISNQIFFIKTNMYAPTMYSLNINPWLKLIHIAGGEALATAAGMLSLYIIHSLLAEKKGNIFAWSILIVICLLSGYAIYVGRFLRFNSWDILNPVHLLSELTSNFSYFTIGFTLLMALYILFIYILFYAFYKK